MLRIYHGVLFEFVAMAPFSEQRRDGGERFNEN